MTSLNRAALERVAYALGPLRNELVFVGGQVAELLVTESGAAPMRTTDDVDAICEATTLSAYDRLADRLRALGFREDQTAGAPLCRWRLASDVLDVMPTEEDVLQFNNAWFEYAVRTAVPHALTNDITIRVATAPAFLATKWDAFRDRGGEDWYGSDDIEDIVRVVGGRPEVIDEIHDCDADVRDFLRHETQRFLEGSAIDVIAGAFPEAKDVPGLLRLVEARFRQIVER